MKTIYHRSIVHLAALFCILCSTGCNESKEAPPPAAIRTFITTSVQIQDDLDLRGTFVWPSDTQLGKYEIAAIAAPLFDPEPAWGAYSGVSQSVVNDTDIQIHLTVTLNSKDSISLFADFCRSLGHEGGVALIYSADDKLFSPRIEEIVGTHTETTNTDKDGAGQAATRSDSE
jgi:hypothetical protein